MGAKMAIYNLTYLINMLGLYLGKKGRKTVFYITVLLLIFICGTRYYLGGSDVYVYENVYNTSPSMSALFKYMFTGINEGVNTNYEIGFILICSLFKSMRFSYFGFILVFTVIFYLLMIKGLKRFVSSWSVFFATFMYKIMFYNTFISIRQGFTIAIFCYSLKYIVDKKPLKYFLLCLIAFFIHRGALILFPLYFLRYFKVTRKFYIYYSLIFLPTKLIASSVNIGPLLEKIIDIFNFSSKSDGWTEVTEPISIIHTLECYIVVLLIIFFFNKILSYKNNKEAKLILQLFLVVIPIFTLFSEWIVLTRIKDYFVIFYGLIFGYVIDGGTTKALGFQTENVKEEVKGVTNAKIISLIVFACCLIGMIRYVFVFDKGHLMQFESFIFMGESIFT